MEAGLEHLGRATASAVDAFIAVVEPGRRSLNTAHQIALLAQHIGVKNTYVVGNKVRNDADRDFIVEQAGDLPVIGYLPFSMDAIGADMSGQAVYDAAPELVEAVRQVAERLDEQA
jgi:CO dehydrogenase maturation factor